MPANNPTRRRLVGLRHDAQVDLALERLARLVRLDREYGPQLNEAGLRLLRASAFSAYCDCRALGIVARADKILAGITSVPTGTGAADAAPAEAVA